ncbi:MAG: hypothetical protein R2726_19345 [Acidimicrobiales bacterium]
MEPVVAVIAVGIVTIACIVMLGWVDAYRTRKATREALDRTITPISDEHAIGLVTHQASEDRIREATAQQGDDADDDAR